MASAPFPPPGPDPATLAHVLVFGSPATRRRLAEDLARRNEAALWGLLLATIRSRESWLVRARCLEVLGAAAGCAEQPVAELILRAICASPGPDGAAPLP